MRILASLVSVLPLFAYACSDSSERSGTNLGAQGDATTAAPTTTTTATTPIADAAPDVTDAGPINPIGLNGCTVYRDLTAADAGIRNINWTLPVVPPLPDGCIRIKKGQSVTWTPSPDFTTHPLASSPKGNLPSPISDGVGATPKIIAFPNEGVFPFVCKVHTGMQGVIHVVP